MISLLITLIIIVAILLILISAIQSSKKEGLDSTFGSTGAGQIIGVKKTGDLLEQTTWGLMILLFSLSLTSAIWIKKDKGVRYSPNIERAQEQIELPETQEESSAAQEETKPE